MSDALIIAVTATVIAGLIISAVTWMLILPARTRRRQHRVKPQSEPPLPLAERWMSLNGRSPSMPQIEFGPLDLEAMQQARGEFAEAEQLTQAARCAQVLRHYGRDEKDLRSQAQRARRIPNLGRPLSDERWIRQVVSPALDRNLAGIMALLGPEVITWHAHPAERYGLSPAQRVDRATATRPLSRLAPQVAQVVGVRPPQLYLTPSRPARLVHINLDVQGRFQGALAIGGEALKFDDEAVQRFMLGRKLCFMRAEFLLCSAVDGPEDLAGLHSAVVQILTTNGAAKLPTRICGLPANEALMRLRAYLADGRVARMLRRLLSSTTEAPTRQTWGAWLKAVEETSYRCGLLVSGDLDAALSILALDDIASGGAADRDAQIASLCRFYISDAYELLWQGLSP